MHISSGGKTLTKSHNREVNLEGKGWEECDNSGCMLQWLYAPICTLSPTSYLLGLGLIPATAVNLSSLLFVNMLINRPGVAGGVL